MGATPLQLSPGTRSVFVGNVHVFQKGFEKHLQQLLGTAIAAIAFLAINIFSKIHHLFLLHTVSSFAYPICGALTYIVYASTPDILNGRKRIIRALREHANCPVNPLKRVPGFSFIEGLPTAEDRIANFDYNQFVDDCARMSYLEKEELAYRIDVLQEQAVFIAGLVSMVVGALFTSIVFNLVPLSTFGYAMYGAAQIVGAFIVKEAFIFSTRNVHELMLQEPRLFFRNDYRLTVEESRVVERHLYQDTYLLHFFLPNLAVCTRRS